MPRGDVHLAQKKFSAVFKTCRVKLSNNCELFWNINFVAKALPFNVTLYAW